MLMHLRGRLDVPGIDEFEQVADVFGQVSWYLRPASRALLDTLLVLRTIQRTADAWRAQLE